MAGFKQNNEITYDDKELMHQKIKLHGSKSY